MLRLLRVLGLALHQLLCSQSNSMLVKEETIEVLTRARLYVTLRDIGVPLHYVTSVIMM